MIKLCRTCQHTLHLFFAGLFALVMPFICLGAFADPSHPHRFPHFVFVEPEVVSQLPLPTQSDQTHEEHAAHAQHRAPETQKASKLPVGQATSSLILFSIFALSTVGAWLFSPINRRHFIPFSPQAFPKSIALAILLPPPRLAPSL